MRYFFLIFETNITHREFSNIGTDTNDVTVKYNNTCKNELTKAAFLKGHNICYFKFLS